MIEQDKQDHQKFNFVLALFCLSSTFFPACLGLATFRTATSLKPWQFRGAILTGSYCLYRSAVNADTAHVRWSRRYQDTHQCHQKSYLSFIPCTPTTPITPKKLA